MASTHTRQMGAASSHRRLNRHSVSPPHSILPGSFTIHTLDLRDSHLFHLQRRLFLPRTISRQSSDDGETSIGSKRESLIAMILHFNVKRDILSDYDYDLRQFFVLSLVGYFPNFQHSTGFGSLSLYFIAPRVHSTRLLHFQLPSNF